MPEVMETRDTRIHRPAGRGRHGVPVRRIGTAGDARLGSAR
ncbi:hypothetical protein [Microtetraspora glauca]|uniref:Uncharacterized protein n=1 Tax=Microtetraspora glauca TaxID=1996 RepID=A0ABV3GNP6_MICGL